MLFLMNDAYDAVFIRIRKTGSTSVVSGIFKQNAERIDLQNEDFPEEWRSKLVFAFVRNPFDRLVSCLEMFKDHPGADKVAKLTGHALDLNKIMDIVEDDDIEISNADYLEKLKLHAIPMTHRAYHLHEANFIGRFETYEQDMRRLYDRLGIERPDVIPHFRKSSSRDFRAYFDRSTRLRAEQVFSEDLERFEYDF